MAEAGNRQAMCVCPRPGQARLSPQGAPWQLKGSVIGPARQWEGLREGTATSSRTQALSAPASCENPTSQPASLASLSREQALLTHKIKRDQVWKEGNTGPGPARTLHAGVPVFEQQPCLEASPL